MAKLYPLYRMLTIVRKLERHGHVPVEEFVRMVNDEMALVDERYADCSLRTLQRDFRTIEELFGITVSCYPQLGYYIAERDENSDFYGSLIGGLDVMSFIGADSGLRKYIIPDFRVPVVTVDLSAVLSAVRNCQVIEFDYNLVRKGIVVHKRVEPQFVKQSQQRWYVVGTDESDGQRKIFSLDRMTELSVDTSTVFKRESDSDIPSLFRESFGIWNDADAPVEEIVLKYDALDGAFLKTLPLHGSQTVVAEDSDSVTFRLNLRITNDFVMEILSRSRSVEVLAPLHLRLRVHDVLEAAAERNKLHNDMDCQVKLNH